MDGREIAELLTLLTSCANSAVSKGKPTNKPKRIFIECLTAIFYDATGRTPARTVKQGTYGDSVDTGTAKDFFTPCLAAAGWIGDYPSEIIKLKSQRLNRQQNLRLTTITGGNKSARLLPHGSHLRTKQPK